MILLLTGWQGQMGKDSIAGSVYAVHQVYLAKSFLHEWSEISWGDRCGMFEGGYKDFT